MRTKLFAALGALLIIGFGVARFTGLIGNKIRIAAIVSLTGADASLGLGMRNSMQLAVDEVNARGGIQGRKVSLVAIDDQSERDKTGPILVRLSDDKTMVAALENTDPECTSDLDKLLGAKIPNLEAGPSICDPGRFNTLEFRLLPPAFPILMQSAQYAWNNLGARKFVYVGYEAKLGKSAVNQFRRALTYIQKSRVTAGDIAVVPGSSDFSAAVAQIRAQSPDYVFFSGTPRDAGLFLSQLRTAGFTGWFQSATPFPSQELIDVAKDKAEGALQVFQGVPPEDTPGGKAFLEAYAAHGFAEPPSPLGLYAYASAQVLLGALDRSFLTRPSVAGALMNEGFQTAVGPVHFRPNGEEEEHEHAPTYETITLYQVIKGRWVPIFSTVHDKLVPYPAK